MATPLEARTEGGALPGSQARFLLFCQLQGTHGTDATTVDDETTKSATRAELVTSECGSGRTPLLTGVTWGSSSNLFEFSLLIFNKQNPLFLYSNRSLQQDYKTARWLWGR